MWMCVHSGKSAQHCRYSAYLGSQELDWTFCCAYMCHLLLECAGIKNQKWFEKCLGYVASAVVGLAFAVCRQERSAQGWEDEEARHEADLGLFSAR